MEIVNKSLYQTFEYVTQYRTSSKTFAMISIQEPETDGNGIIFTETASCKHVLNIRFSDIDPIFFYDHKNVLEEAIETGKIILFSSEMAKEIKEFFEKIKNNVDLLIIHCSAGVSRSSAIAAVLNKYLNDEENLFFEKSLPNMFIYNIMHTAMFNKETDNIFRGNRKHIPKDNTCLGCIHNNNCNYFEDKENLLEKQKFTKHCIGCYCGDEAECNRTNNNRCNNYETKLIGLGEKI